MARIKYKQGINLTREIKGNNLDLTKGGREKGEKWHIPIETQSPNIGTHKEGEEGELLFTVVPYPIRYCPYAVPINRQQLHQQQSQLRKKRNVQWHYYHLYGSRRTIHYSSHRTRHTILIVTSSRMVGTLSSIIRVPGHPCQHDTII